MRGIVAVWEIHDKTTNVGGDMLELGIRHPQPEGPSYLQSTPWHGGAGIWPHHGWYRDKTVQLPRQAQGGWAMEADDGAAQHAEDTPLWMGIWIKRHPKGWVSVNRRHRKTRIGNRRL